ncbi:hypothetical protein Tco_0621795 [Tanacetum coccineum]
MKREGKDFSGRVTPLFATMMVQANQEEGVDSGIPTASQQTPITIQPSTSKPQKKQSRRKQKKTTAIPHPSDSTADEITNLKLRVKKLEKKTGLRTHKFKRLYKVGVTRRVEYSDDESLGAQEDAFNQGRSIEDIDKDAKVSLADETQRRVLVKANKNTNISIFFSIKDKRKAKMDEPEVPLKKKDQIALDEEMARNLEAQKQQNSLKKKAIKENRKGSQHKL